MKTYKDELTMWCTCGGDHCLRLRWFSDEPDEAWMDLVDSFGSRQQGILRRLRSCLEFLVRGSVCRYGTAEVVLDTETRRKLAEWLMMPTRGISAG